MSLAATAIFHASVRSGQFNFSTTVLVSFEE